MEIGEELKPPRVVWYLLGFPAPQCHGHPDHSALVSFVAARGGVDSECGRLAPIDLFVIGGGDDWSRWGLAFWPVCSTGCAWAIDC